MRITETHRNIFKIGCCILFMEISANCSIAAEQPDQTAQNQQTTQQEPDTQKQPAAQEENMFDLLEVRIKGNTLLEQTQLERTVYPFLGTQKNIDTVEQARTALENLYHAKGYQTVIIDIPEQNVDNGVVYLQVVEGKVSRLRVTHSRYFALGKIKAGVPELAEGKIPNLPIMQQQLAAIDSQSADRKVTPILRAGETPGTLEVDLKVKDELPLHGSIALNGRNTSSTSRLRLVTSLHYDNLWQKMHSASLMYQVSPENSDEVEVWAGTYAMPLFDTDAKLALYAVSSSSNAQVASVGALSVIGIGSIYGLRVIEPLPSTNTFNQSLTLGMDYKDFKENLNLMGADTQKTPITYLPFMLQYNGSVRDQKSLLSFNVGVNFSIRGLGNDQDEFSHVAFKKDAQGNLVKDDKGNPIVLTDVKGNVQYDGKRPHSQANYAYLTAGVNFNHDLPWEMELASRFSGQLANSPLISNEQFSLGGMQSIRGYFETQALADDGFIGSLELRSPRLVSHKLDYIDNLQALAFIEGGYGGVQQSSPGTPNHYELASVGVGLRFQVWKYFVGALDLGIPLLDLKPVQQGDPKLHFNIATEF